MNKGLELFVWCSPLMVVVAALGCVGIVLLRAFFTFLVYIAVQIGVLA